MPSYNTATKRPHALLHVIIFLLLTASGMALRAQTIVSGTQSGVWTLAGSPYVVNGHITINNGESLTIEPGVVVEFRRYDFALSVYGRLIAAGTVTDSIRFVGKGNYAYNTQSTHGGAIILAGDSALMQYVAIDSMGDASVYGYAVNVSQGHCRITQSSIRNSEGNGLYITEGFTPVISDCIFPGSGNDISSWLGGGGMLSNVDNAVIKIRAGTVTINSVMVRPGMNSYYEMEGANFVNTGVKLVIEPGVTLRFPRYDHALTIYGTLIAAGTASDSIHFTGKANYSYSPQSTHGGAIILAGDSALMQYVAIDSMGDASVYGYAVNVSQQHCRIAQSSVRNSEGKGIYINDDFQPSLDGNRFGNNLTGDVECNVVSTVRFLNNQAANIYLRQSSLSADAVIPNPGNSSRYTLAGPIYVNAGELKILPGTTIDFRDLNGSIFVYSTITAIGTSAAPISFVKLPGSGQTNYGGTVVIAGGSTNSVLSHVNFDRLGSIHSSSYALGISTSDVSLSNLSITNSEDKGLYLDNNASPVIVASQFFNNISGIYSVSGKAVLNNCNIYDNSGWGINNVSSVITDTIDARSCWWGHVSGPLHATDNPAGTANKVSDKVLFNPWLTSPAVDLVNDLGVSLIVSPSSACTPSGTAQVTVRVYNFGNTPQSGFNVSYRINNGPTITENAGSLSVAGLSYADYTFSQLADVSAAGNYYVVKAYTSLVNDATFTNDTITSIVFIASLTAPGSLLPADNAVGVNRPVAFSWSPVINASSYNLYVWPSTATVPTAPTINNIIDTAYLYASTSLVFGETYRWKVSAVRDSCFAESSVQLFTLKSQPDLYVESVTSSHPIVAPGDSVTLSWTVGNQGVVAYPGNWTERISIQSVSGDNRTYLTQSDFTSTSLAASQSIARSGQVVMPEYLYIGDNGVFVVEIFPAPGVLEMTDSNNVAVQAAPWAIKKVLSFELSSTEIFEGEAGGIIGTVNRTGSLTDEITVNISGGSSFLSFPASVTVPAYAAGASFIITVPENSIASGVIRDTLVATAINFESDSAIVSVNDNDFSILSFSNLPTTTTEGNVVTFSIVTNHVSSSPLEIFLTSSDPLKFPLPSSVIIPADSLSKSVSVTLQQDNIPEIETTVTITAGANNHLPADSSFVIQDDDIPNIELALQTGLISESAGLYATTATLRRTSGDNSISFTANLSASLPGVLILPASISLAQGETEKTFTIGVVDNNLVDTLREVIITASVFVSACNCSAPASSAGNVNALLKVSDNDGPAILLTTIPQTLPEGVANAGALRVARNTSAALSLIVSLTSSDTTEARLPTTVIIPANETFVDVAIMTIDDDTADGNQTVFLEASSAGFATGVTWVTVSDQNKPDLLVSSATVSNFTPQIGELVTYQVGIKNAGTGTAGTGLELHGYLSADDVIDNGDTLITTKIISQSIQAGQTVPVLQAFTVPDRAGSFRLLFTINPSHAIEEFQINNNNAEPVILSIIPGYTASANVEATYFLQGAPVTVTGLALRPDATPAVNKPVEVFVIVNGLRRSMLATTGASGQYTTQFVPLPGESGHYSVGASYPGMNDTTSQDAFDIAGVRINNNSIPRFSAIIGDTLRGKLAVKNLSDLPLDNFALSPVALPGGASMQFGTIDLLAGGGTDSIPYSVTGSAVSTGNNYYVASFRAVSTQGDLQPVTFYYYCQAPGSYLVSSITNIQANVAESPGEKIIQFTLYNRGAAPTGTTTINLPQVNWLSSVTPVEVQSIPPGDSTSIALKFRAPADVPSGYPVSGTIGIGSQNGNSLTIPFTYQKVSSSNGTVKVIATNQFTYYMPNSPNVSGAHVKIRHQYSGAMLAEGYTDQAGIFIANNIPDGNHRITVEKEKHLPYNNAIIVNAADTTTSVVFLNYQAITFSWTVVPTAIQDEYTLTLTSQFETNIPIPVVTIEMQDSLPALTGDQTYPFMMTLINHGLITARDVTLNMPGHPDYEFVTNYQTMDIGALQSVSVPVLLKRRAENEQGGKYTSPGVAELSAFLGIQTPSMQGKVTPGCTPATITGTYWYECNSQTGLWEPLVKPVTVGETCPGAYNPETGVFNPGGLYSWLFTFLSMWGGPPGNGGGSGPIWDGYPNCDTCNNANVNPPVPPSPFENLLKNCNLPSCALDLLKALSPCRAAAGAAAAGLSPLAAYQLGRCIRNLQKLLDSEHCPELAAAIMDALSQLGAGQKNAAADEAALTVVANYLADMLFVANVYGTRENWSYEYFGELIYSPAWNEIAESVATYVNNRDTIPNSLRQSLLMTTAGYGITEVEMNSYINRWNTSIDALRNNVMQPNGQFPGIINWTRVAAFEDSISVAMTRITDEGFASAMDMYNTRYDELMEFVDQQKDAVCASVTVQFSQQLTMTREAFDGTLGIFNAHPSDPMDSITVNIKITDQAGVSANNHFEILTTNLTNILNVIGTGSIGSEETGSVKFLFIPKISAAPTAPKVYNFGGSVRYWDPYVDTFVTIPLNAVPITVNPSPNLALHYFMERNILGDDALTSPAIEPSVPAELAVMVENQGYGAATNLTISSSQPKIVDNEKGLAIDFNLVASNFQGQPRNFGVTDIPFGTIPPLQARVGQWYFTSSLLGKFVSYEAEVVHNNSFGNPELSLINGVKLHELTRSVRDYRSQADSINDFLVNDIFDLQDYPDRIYFSQGREIASVHPATSGNFSAPVAAPTFRNILTVAPSKAGWNYIKLDDPGNGLYTLDSVIRSDGQVIPLNNAWLTFVTLPVGKPPVYENKFHIVDTFHSLTPADYLVVWKPKNTDIPKVDSISGAPAHVSTVSVGNLKVVFNKRIDPSTFTFNDLSLTLQGGPNLLDASAIITQVDSSTFNVDLSALTAGDGQYIFTAQAAGVTDMYGVNGDAGKQVSWTQFLHVPAIQAFTGIPQNRISNSFNTIQVLFNLPINAATVTSARFTVTRDGIPQNGSITIDSVRTDQRLFYLSGLSGIMTTSGEYLLTVDVPQVKSLNDIPGQEQQSITLTLDNTGPAMVNLATSDSAGLDAQHIPFVKMEFTEAVQGLNISAVQLIRNGDVIPLPITQLSAINPEFWTAGNFGLLTYPDGNYTFTVFLDQVKDAAGNFGSGIAQVSWSVDRTTRMTVSNLVAGPDLGHSNIDGVTSGHTFNISFTLDEAASSLVISQFDLSGEIILSTMQNLAVGTHSMPVTLPAGGQTNIRVTATGMTGRTGTAELLLFVDRIPLNGRWIAPLLQVLPTQPDTISLQFSARILDDGDLLSAISFEREGIQLPTSSLSIDRLNDTLYRVGGLREVSTAAGAYQLEIDLSSLSKYSSGLPGVSSPAVSWMVQSSNRAPIANAGEDTVITMAGVTTLNATRSTDPDGDSLRYRWIAPQGITLTDSTSGTPSFTVTGAVNGTNYPFLLIVSDSMLYSMDAVNVGVNYSICPGEETYFTVHQPGDGYTYQWQIDSTGTGFVNLANDAVHSGVNEDTLHILSPASNRYGHLYRCISAKGSFVIYSSVYAVKFQSIWLGTVSSAWENPANWSCNKVPDAFTDVLVQAAGPHSPVVSSIASCRSLTLSNQVIFTVADGYSLNITGRKP